MQLLQENLRKTKVKVRQINTIVVDYFSLYKNIF